MQIMNHKLIGIHAPPPSQLFVIRLLGTYLLSSAEICEVNLVAKFYLLLSIAQSFKEYFLLYNSGYLVFRISIWINGFIEYS